MTFPPVRPAALQALKADLAGLAVADDPPSLKMASRDFFWFSPLLKAELDDKRADLVVTPRTRDELGQVAAACARHRVPLTIRGGGTGNYGQAIPLAGGLVVDMRHLNRMIFARTGACRFEAGANMLAMDQALRPHGQELRFHPSTRAQASIGGFVAGGAGGVGSCTWGQIDNPGAVTALQVMTVEAEPRLIELRGRDILKVMHAYGVNGIITEVELPTAPAHDWAERIVVFDTLMAAAEFGQAFTECDGIAKKLVSIHDPRISPYLRRLKPFLPDGKAFAIIMVSEPQAETFELMVADHGGTITYRRGAEAHQAIVFDGAKGDGPGPLYEYTWNHTTLHALKLEPTVTYLQLRFPPPDNLKLVAWAIEAFREDVLFHLEFQRRQGRVFNSSLPIVKFTTPERLMEIQRLAGERGIQVSNPHTYLLNAAGWKKIDAPQPEFKRLADPFGLMNPGKLIGWEAEAAQAAE